MSLYLKYRPKSFDEVVGQRHITDILKRQVLKGQTMHNYLFFGSRGTGKTTVARILARAVNCLNNIDGNPCNQCEVCQEILNGQSIDIVEIDAASYTQVDNIREEIISKEFYPPVRFKKKVYIIDEVHMLSKAAFNALLKIMEEPPSYFMFILATTEIHKVPDTIISRCQVFNFKKLSEDDIVLRLEYIAKNESIDYDIEGLKLIAQVSDGAMRDAVKYLEQISVFGKVDSNSVQNYLGIASKSLIVSFLDILKNGSLKDIIDFVYKLESSGIDLSNFAKQVLLYIDENFMNDIDFNLKISSLFKNILLDLKFYPRKDLVYKVILANYFKRKENLVENMIEEKRTEDRNIQNLDLDTFKNLLLQKLDRLLLKPLLQRCNFVELGDDYVKIEITNPAYRNILLNHENLESIKKTANLITGKDFKIIFL